MRKVFNKGLKESDKKEGLLKRLKNIEGKMNNSYKQSKTKEKKQSETIIDQKEKQLDAISDQEGMTRDDKKRVKRKLKLLLK